jgi:hypothetical protein
VQDLKFVQFVDAIEISNVGNLSSCIDSRVSIDLSSVFTVVIAAVYSECFRLKHPQIIALLLVPKYLLNSLFYSTSAFRSLNNSRLLCRDMPRFPGNGHMCNWIMTNLRFATSSKDVCEVTSQKSSPIHSGGNLNQWR